MLLVAQGTLDLFSSLSSRTVLLETLCWGQNRSRLQGFIQDLLLRRGERFVDIHFNRLRSRYLGKAHKRICSLGWNARERSYVAVAECASKVGSQQGSFG